MLCYVVRHAESTLNANQGGGPNSELTDLGRRQAEAIADRLAAARPHAIYSSPYWRALQTAEPLARRLGLPILVRHELCEYNPPSWPELAGWSPPAVEDIFKRIELAQRDPDDDGAIAWPPITETLTECIARTRRLATFLKSRWTDPNDAIVAFGHGLPVARLIDAWLSDASGPAFRFVIDNAAVSALRFRDGVSSLICLNEASHLVGLPQSASSNFGPGFVVKPKQPGAYW